VVYFHLNYFNSLISDMYKNAQIYAVEPVRNVKAQGVTPTEGGK